MALANATSLRLFAVVFIIIAVYSAAIIYLGGVMFGRTSSVSREAMELAKGAQATMMHFGSQTPFNDRESVVRKKFAQNSDPTNTVEISLPSIYTDLIWMIKGGLKLNPQKGAVHVWLPDGSPLDYLMYEKILANSTLLDQFPKWWVTQGNEKLIKVNGAFYYLLTKNQDWKWNWFMRSLTSVRDLYNNRWGPYPIIVFTDYGQNKLDEIRTKYPKQRFYFVDVDDVWLHNTLPDLPIFRNITYHESLNLGSMCYYKGKHGWQLEYLSMIRFRSVLLWRHPIFQYFDYVIQIDSDVAFLDIKLDLFEQIARKNKVLGFLRCINDVTCAKDLQMFTDDWASEHDVQFKHKQYNNEDTGYYGNFWVINMRWFYNNRQFLQYMDYIDHLGGIFWHRWAEQVTIPKALSMFADFDDLYVIGSKLISLIHNEHKLSSEPACPDIRKAYSCCFEVDQ